MLSPNLAVQENIGTTRWAEVKEDYEVNDGTIVHPLFPNYVLQKRDESSEPDYITFDSFKFRKKMKKEFTKQVS